MCSPTAFQCPVTFFLKSRSPAPSSSSASLSLQLIRHPSESLTQQELLWALLCLYFRYKTTVVVTTQSIRRVVLKIRQFDQEESMSRLYTNYEKGSPSEPLQAAGSGLAAAGPTVPPHLPQEPATVCPATHLVSASIRGLCKLKSSPPRQCVKQPTTVLPRTGPQYRLTR